MRRLQRAILGTAVFATLVLPLAEVRGGSSLGPLPWLWLLCLCLLVLVRTGRARLASVLLVVGLAAFVTASAALAGGIRSPCASAFLVVPLVAFMTLGERAAFATAALCATLGLGLVALQLAGRVPPVSLYFGPLSYWLIECAGLGMVLTLIRVSNRVLGTALAATREELARRLLVEARLELALEAGEIGTWEFDPHQEIFRAGPRALAILGFATPPWEPVALEAWLAKVHPEDRDWIMSRLQELVAGEPRVQVVYRAFPQPDRMRWIEGAGQAHPDSQGQVHVVSGTCRDVTEVQLARIERERLVFDLGERVKELKLLHRAATLLQDDRPVDRALLAELAAALGSAFRFPEVAQARITWQDLSVEEPAWVETGWRLEQAVVAAGSMGRLEVGYRSLPPDPGGGPPSGEDPFLPEERSLLASLAHLLEARLQRDAHERLRADLERQLRQTQKLEALGNLAGGIAHDFNNILAAIVAEAELARETLPEGSPARTAFEHVLSASGRARDLVQRIRAFSRRQELVREPVRLAEVVEEALELLRATLPANIRVQARYAPDLPVLHSNPTQLHQILLNLGTNAFHAMSATGGELRVEVDAVHLEDSERLPSSDLVPGPHLHVSVSDTGAGMEPEVLEHAFEPFFTTKGVEGTGLGLSVVHGIVREHAGAITVRSRPGQGTRFDLWFPVRTEADSPRLGVDSSEPQGGSQRILVVDDEEALAHLMVRTLERLGYRAMGFQAPALALQAIREEPTGFDALVTDLSMPGMTGLELAAAVRAIAPGLPIAICTGRTEDLGTLAPALGIEVVIAKPAKRTELAQALARLLSPRQGGEPLPAVS